MGEAQVAYGFKFHSHLKKMFSYSTSDKWGICNTQQSKVLHMYKYSGVCFHVRIGFLGTINGECDMDFQDPFLESEI